MNTVVGARRKGRRRKAVVFGLLAACLLVGGALWWATRDHAEIADNISDIFFGHDEGSAADADAEDRASEKAPTNTMVPTTLEQPWLELPPQLVIDSPDCYLVAGTGHASGLAVALARIPSEDTPWYAVVGEGGVLFGGHLSLDNERARVDLGRRRDGGVLMGFRTTDRTSMIVLDGQPIYEAEGVWDFEIAPDGSSFIAIEPLAGGATRLVIRNLDLGIEAHHDLGDLLEDRPGNHVWYSADAAEAIVTDGVTHRFYPVDGGEPRVAHMRKQGREYIMARSHDVSYRGREERELTRIARVAHRYGEDGAELETVEVWSRTFPYAEVGEPIEGLLVSDDGAWAVQGFERSGVVLEASTGRTVTVVPFDEESRKARGNPTGVHFRDDRLLLYRQRSFQQGGRPVVQRFVEVFRPDTADLEGNPYERTLVDTFPQQRFSGFFGADFPEGFFELSPHGGTPEAPCARPHLSDGRFLVADDGRLTFRRPNGLERH